MRTTIRAIVTALGLFLALPALPARAGGFCQEGKVTEGTGTTVEMKDSCYTPTVLRTDSGAEVTWVNRDAEHHTVTAAGGAWGDSHKEIARKETITIRFREPGVYSYSCLLHPGMAGTVVVGNASGKGGAAEIVDVRPVALNRPSRNPGPPPTDSGSGLATAGLMAGIAAVAAAGGFGLGRRRRATATT